MEKALGLFCLAVGVKPDQGMEDRVKDRSNVKKDVPNVSC